MSVCGWCGINMKGIRKIVRNLCKTCAPRWNDPHSSGHCPKNSKRGQVES